jgi:hypothetical protein
MLTILTLAESELPTKSFDRAYCISTIEHLEWHELCRTVQEASRLLREGGLFVLTIDLFLNLVPFTRRKKNQFGVNISVRDLIAEAGMDRVYGEKSELYGFNEFKADDITTNLERYLVGQDYPSLTQLLILGKGRADDTTLRTNLFSDFVDLGLRRRRGESSVSAHGTSDGCERAAVHASDRGCGFYQRLRMGQELVVLDPTMMSDELPAIERQLALISYSAFGQLKRARSGTWTRCHGSTRANARSSRPGRRS